MITPFADSPLHRGNTGGMAAAFDSDGTAANYVNIAIQAGISGAVAHGYTVDRSAADNKSSNRARLQLYKDQSGPTYHPCR